MRNSLIKECDNKKKCHALDVIAEDICAQRVICKECKITYIVRKNPWNGAPENRGYSKIFKKDVLQGKDNLFYKYHPQWLRT